VCEHLVDYTKSQILSEIKIDRIKIQGETLVAAERLRKAAYYYAPG